ncbi:hypothetical protein ABOM_000897 [Aspergillus bombycis]|uniref:Uncharacterized protein n=1 Tax=Aspergillus bombycis TaxID=109264 RepID=A0A1F8AFA9_9EURO|nr:hypothetical protein ABOM_000897 [Aspergillus bombycis]OGM50443.1 hypothetical protein ABOM_000897 [Aspergillus bombycis]
MAPSDNEGDPIDIKKGLNLALDDIRSPGSFMAGANIHTAVNPGLHIPDVGNIGLPISAEHAKAIIQSCHPSPYGKGTETLVDESVRKSWQPDASQFTLQNPIWQHQVEMFMDKAVTGLGLAANWPEVKAELYKLLIYQEGAFFLPHRESEKADGMFGTLARQSLNLGCHGLLAALLESHGGSTENITRLLQSWACAAEVDSMQYPNGWSNCIYNYCPPALIYVLEHQYTSAELGFSRLKGIDQCRFAGLRDACQRAGFDIFLANIEKEDMGEVDDDDGDSYGDFYGRRRNRTHRIRDLIETSLKLSHVVDSEGVIIGKNLPFPDLLIIQNGVFDRFQGALKIPRRFRFLFTIQRLKHGQGDVLKVLEDCHRAVLEQPNDMRAKQKLLQVCRVITPVESLYELYARPQEGQDKVLQIALELSDVELFCRAMKWLDIKDIPLYTVQALTYSCSLDKILQKGRSSGTQYKKSFSRSMNMLYRLIEEYHDGDLAKAFDAHSGGSESDGHDLAKELSDFPTRRVLSRAIPFLKTKLDNTVFIVAFITSAHDYSLAGKFHKGDADAVLKMLFSKIVGSFKIESNDSMGVINALTEHALDVKEGTEESAFDDFLFPVANGICAHIDTANRSSTASERRFIKHMLAKYVRDYVKEAPPSPPPDWKKRTTIRCICSNCASLRMFIDDTSSTTKDFELGEKRRQHLDQQLDKAFFTTLSLEPTRPSCELKKHRLCLFPTLKPGSHEHKLRTSCWTSCLKRAA